MTADGTVATGDGTVATGGPGALRPGPLDRRLLDAVPGARLWTAGLAALEAFRGGAIAAQAVTIALAVAAVASPHPTPAGVGGYLVIFTAATVVRAAVSVVAGRLAMSGAQRAAMLLRRRGVAFLLAARWSPEAPQPEAPQPAVVLGPGLDAVENYVYQVVPSTVAAAVITPIVAGTIGWIDPLSLAILAVPLGLVPVFMILIGRRTREQTARRWHALAGMSARFLDAVEGLATLRAFDRTGHERQEMADAAEGLRRATMRVLAVAFLSAFALELLATMGTALVAVPLGLRLVGGRITLAPALAVLVLAPEVFIPVRRAASNFHASTEGRAALDAYGERFCSGTAVSVGADRTGPAGVARRRTHTGQRTPAAAGDPGTGLAICVRGLRVGGGGDPVLDGVDLDIAPGERVGLLGPSGAGKTTLLQVVIGLVEPAAGTVRISGSVDRDGFFDPARTAGWRRSMVAWVGQHPLVVAGTVRDNLVLGTAEGPDGRPVDDGALWDALDLAGLATFVAGLPDGLASPVGENGVGMSAGERQRLAVARALARPGARLVILDEPTSHLDPASERRLVDRLAAALAGRTVLLASHRGAPLDMVTRTVTLSRGTVVGDEAIGHPSIGHLRPDGPARRAVAVPVATARGGRP